MNQHSYQILKILQEKKLFSPLKSISLKELMGNNFNVTPNTINYIIKDLEKQEYIKQGLKCGKAYTYYITMKGVNVVNALEG